MRLIKLTSDHKSFHPVEFHDGINIIVGKKSNPDVKDDGNTFNGVGKSLIAHLLHFCLCCNKIDSLEKSLPDWSFTLQFSSNTEHHSITRNTSQQNKIVFDDEEYKLTDARNKLLLLAMDDEDLTDKLKFNPMLSKFVRRYRTSYIKYSNASDYDDAYKNLLYNSALLGLNTDLVVSKKNIRIEQETVQKTEKALKKDPVFKQYYLGNSDIQMDADDLEFAISKLQEEIASFKISSNYHEIEEQANNISSRKKDLENQLALLENNILHISEALKIQADDSFGKVVEMYEKASVEIPDMVKKSLREVEDFHKSLLQTRNLRLKEELRKNQGESREKKQEIANIGIEMDNLLGYLNTHGALEEYTALNKQLTDLQLQLNHIKDYQKMLKEYQSRLNNIKEQMIIENRDTEEYLNAAEPFLKNLRQKYSEMTREFYPRKKSGLSISNDSGENQLRYNIEARIEDDSSDGVNEVKIFCFDMLLMMQGISNFEFVLHDSRLFANMDPRQRTTLFRIACRVCTDYGVQYIASINEDALDSIKEIMDEVDYKRIIEDRTILTLNDDSSSSKLLGIQVDVDLESKR